jgi:NAD(P)H-hydrate epimerase
MKSNLIRAQNSHKGNYGHAVIVAGSRGMAGAAYLAAKAALRSGVGKVTLATTPELYCIIASSLPECLHLPLLSGDRGEIIGSRGVSFEKYLSKVQALAIGPGLGRSSKTLGWARTQMRRSALPIVADADALFSLKGHLNILTQRKRPMVITPHDGEGRELFGAEYAATGGARMRVAKQMAKQYHCILVRKGPNTLVASPDSKLFVNSSGNAGMASAGMGDVLTGLIAGFLAQGFAEELAAKMSVWIHGEAGDRAQKKMGSSALIASDVLENIPGVIMSLEQIKNLNSYFR